MKRDRKRPAQIEESEWLGFQKNDRERKVVVVIALLWAALLSILCIWQSLEIYRLADRVNNLEAAGYMSAPSTSEFK